MMSRVLLALIPLLLASQARAVPLRISVSEAEPSQASRESVPAIIVAKLHSTSTATAPKKRSFELLVPGQKSVDLEPATWSFALEVKGFWSNQRTLVIKEGENDVHFDLWPTGTLHAQLSTPAGEEPPKQILIRFEPAPVRTSPDEPEAEPRGEVVCAAQGDPWICQVPEGRLDLRLTAGSYITQYRWGVDVGAGRALDLGIIQFRRGSAVVGWVVREDGQAAEDTEIILNPRAMDLHTDFTARSRLERLSLSTKANDRGFFHIDGVTPGEYIIEARKKPFAPTRATVQVGKDQETVVSNPPLILQSPQVVEVYVDPPVAPTGEQWLIKMTQLDRGSRVLAGFARTPVSTSGSWVKEGVPPGRYWLTLGIAGDDRWFAQEIEVATTMPPIFVDMPVVEIRGTVLWGDDPLSSEVLFKDGNRVVTVALESDTEGRFEGFLPNSGIWEVDVVGVDAAVRRSFQQIEVKKRPGKSYAEVEIRVPDTKLEGVVVDQSGTPAEKATVTVQSLDEIVSAVRKKTDSEGKFKVYGLPPGLATVIAEGLTSEEISYSDNMALTLDDGGEPKRVRLVLRPEMRIQGRIVSGSLGVPGARIMAVPTDIYGLPTFPETSDAEGNFEVHLPSSTQDFFLNVAAPGFAYQFLRLPADPDQSLIIQVDEPRGTLILALPDSLDRNLWNSPKVYLHHRGAIQALSFFSPWAQFSGQTQEGDNRFIIPNMEPGEYSACLIHPAKRFNLLEGSEIAGRCTGGHLAASGELRLTLAGPDPD